MEIIGASIMNGYGNLGDDLGCQPAYEVYETLLSFHCDSQGPSMHAHKF